MEINSKVQYSLLLQPPSNKESGNIKGEVNTEESELKEFVIRDKALSIAGEPAPWAESDPTSSWSNKATILTPGSFSRLV